MAGDRVWFVFWTQWTAAGAKGVDALSDFSERHVFDDPHIPRAELIGQARRAHEAACEGRWVRHGMHSPHVSALRVVRGGRILEEELAAKRDLPEFAQATTDAA